MHHVPPSVWPRTRAVRDLRPLLTPRHQRDDAAGDGAQQPVEELDILSYRGLCWTPQHSPPCWSPPWHRRYASLSRPGQRARCPYDSDVSGASDNRSDPDVHARTRQAVCAQVTMHKRIFAGTSEPGRRRQVAGPHAARRTHEPGRPSFRPGRIAFWLAAAAISCMLLLRSMPRRRLPWRSGEQSINSSP